MSAARKFTGEKLKQLREDYKRLRSYRKVAALHNTGKETVRFSLNIFARKKFRIYVANYSINNKQKVRNNNRKATKKYRAKNLEKARAWERKSKKKWIKQHPEAVMLRNAKSKCKEKGLDFNLELSDIKIPKRCPVLGIPLIRGKRRTDNTPSLDQINRTRGYVKGNVAVVSWRANRLKNDATLAEITAIAAYMRRNERIHERSNCGV
jgi:hypothetical protein